MKKNSVKKLFTKNSKKIVVDETDSTDLDSSNENKSKNEKKNTKSVKSKVVKGLFIQKMKSVFDLSID